MARSGRVIINPEHLAGYGGTDLRTVISVWSARVGPVTYNQWQSAYFALIREYECVDNQAVAGESPSDRQTRMRNMWNEVQSEAHGPDHLAQAFAAQEQIETVGEYGEPEVPAAVQERMLEDVDLEGQGAQGRAEDEPVVPYEQFGMNTPRDAVSYTHLTLPTKA